MRQKMPGDNVRHSKLASGLARIGGRARELLGHAEGTNAQGRRVAEHGDDLVREGGGQVVKLLIVTRVLKWQDCHSGMTGDALSRFLLGQEKPGYPASQNNYAQR